MAELKDPHHEHFCLLIARGSEHGEAFLKARDPQLRPAKNLNQSAYGLLKNPRIQARIKELKEFGQEARLEEVRARLEEVRFKTAVQTELIKAEAKLELIERQWVIAELKDNVTRAKNGDNFDGSVANRALELLGKEIGMFIDRSENYNVNNVIRSEPLTEQEWAEQFIEQPKRPN